MAVQWEFYRQKPTDPIHNPISGEFFSTEAVGNVAEALVREGIQNTLDAHRVQADGTRHRAGARIFLSEMTNALPGKKAQRWFGSLWPHVIAPGNGLRNQPGPYDPCPYLVFEDFGTIGLTGDPGEHTVITGRVNHFLNFFRAEGYSDKGENDRGSWGVGKTVFPRASRISSFFGLTVRSDDNKHLLLGRSILKYHSVASQPYKSDGYFGHFREDGLALPCDDPRVLEEFQTDFHIKRRSESGLSIVVPWYDLDGEDPMTREKIIDAVLRGYFYPILMGHLTVTVATPGGELILSAGSIIDTVKFIGGSLTQMLPMLELAEWARTRLDSEFQPLLPPRSYEAQKWSPDLVPAEVLGHIRDSLAQRRRIALHVPMHVQKQSGTPEATYFHIFLEHSEDDREKPVFIRDELIISNVQSPRLNQVRALVIVEDKPLAKLLRDAETPAHTQWNPGTSHFRDKYKFGPGAIKFVRESVSQLLTIVNQAEQEPDPSITIDYFWVPAEPEDEGAVPARRRKAKRKGDDTETDPIEIKERTRPRFRIEKMPGGFSIKPGDPEAPPPPYDIDIRLAYDVRRGNPLKKYDPADFVLGKAPIQYHIPQNGIVVKKAEANRMLVTVKQADFQLDVTGFDLDRELLVRADAKEPTNDQAD